MKTKINILMHLLFGTMPLGLTPAYTQPVLYPGSNRLCYWM
jgi:hypothetical protein